MKKKNLLKCLALTSMLALSVGAVTSCGTQVQGQQGPKGEQGEKGETGEQGPQGEKGEAGKDGVDGLTPTIGENGNWWIGDKDTGIKAAGQDGADGEKGDKGDKGETGEAGQDGVTPNIGANGNWWIGDIDTGIVASPVGANGKTYMPIMIYGAAKDVIKQDKYFVEVGDTFTLSWTNTGTDASLKIMTNLEINGEIVNYELGATEWSHTVVEGDKGWQVTDFSYGTLLEYSTQLLREHYSSIAKADLNVQKLTDSDTAVNQSGKLGYFVGDSVFTKFSEAKTALENNHNTNKAKPVAERLQLIKEELAKQTKIIDDEYAKLVKEAKNNALNGLKKLYENAVIDKNGLVTSDNLTGRKEMTNADREALLAIATEKINAVTTLYDIGSLVKNGTGYTTFEDGSINILEGYRKAAFEKVSTALTTITGTDTALNDEHLKDTRATLKEYGIEVLPNDVHAEYVAKISAATELPLVKGTTNVVLAEEGAEAITDSYKGIFSKISQGIINSYYKDIDKSTALDLNGKTTAKSLVYNNITNWFATHSTAKISEVIGAAGAVTQVENAFNSDRYTAFNNERKGWIAEKAYTTLDAKVAKYLEDSVYKALVEATGDDNGYNQTDTNNVVATLETQKGEIKTKVDAAGGTLEEVKTAINNAGTKVDDAYTAALALYKGTATHGYQPAAIATDETEKINIAGTTSGLTSDHRIIYQNYVTEISKPYNKDSAKLGAQSFTEYKGLVDGLEAKKTALKALDAGYTSWLLTKAADTKYITSGTALTTDLFYTDNIHQELEVIANGIMTGTKTTSDVTIFTAGLEASYNKGISELAASYKELLLPVYNSIVGLNPAKALEIKAVYEKLINSYGQQVKIKWTAKDSGTITAIDGFTNTDGTVENSLDFKGKTYLSAFSWYTVTYKLMQSVAEGGTVVFVA